MANRPGPALGLRDSDRAELRRLTRSFSARAGLAQRARIVLLAADGMSNTASADRVGVSRPTGIGWRSGYAASGVAGLADEPRSGRPRRLDHGAIITATPKPPPKRLGSRTHGSTRLLAQQLGIGDARAALSPAQLKPSNGRINIDGLARAEQPLTTANAALPRLVNRIDSPAPRRHGRAHPGHVRELQNALQGAATMTDRATLQSTCCGMLGQTASGPTCSRSR